MIYAETLFLDVQPGRLPELQAALGGIRHAGLWTADIGHLSRLTVLRVGDTPEELRETRGDVLEAVPVDILLGQEATLWRCLRPALPAGSYGAIHEWRCYDIRPGQEDQVARAFLDAIPGRLEHSDLLIAMVSLDGRPRIAHIWPYSDLAQRAAVRAAAVATGKWPPAVAPYLSHMENDILIPVSGSQWR